jgi:phenylalanyl-tRNA synthetase beta subunit
LDKTGSFTRHAILLFRALEAGLPRDQRKSACSSRREGWVASTHSVGWSPASLLFRFPLSIRLIVDEAITAGCDEAEIHVAGGEVLAGPRLFDLDMDHSIAAGKKSLAHAFTYQAAERTRTDKQVDKAHKKIEDR